MFKNILSKGKIGSLELKNRFVMPPMGTSKIGYDGLVNENLIRYYEERARGDFGLIIVEFAAVDPIGKALPDQILISDDTFIPKLKELAHRIHGAGGKAFIQLQHAGRQTVSQITGFQPVAPSAIACPTMHETPRALGTQEVYELVEKFGDAAVRAKKAGFDGVELHGAHGYLIAQFLSAFSNKRIDEFGGDITSRAKFAVDIIKNIKEKCGKNFPISFRISGDEKMSGGMEAEEAAAMARIIEAAGADAIHVSVGMYGSLEWTIAPAAVPQGFNIPDTRIIKKAVKVPVIAVGRIVDPVFADKLIADGDADFVSFGRGSLADPFLPAKIKEGRYNEVLQCIGCMTRCQGFKVLESDKGVSCMVNPFAGFESEREITPAARVKNIVVVGGGPAGLMSAWVAAARGHRVTLLEKGERLGGQFLPASVPPAKHDMLNSIKYYVKMCEKYGVDIKTNTEATAETIEALRPDEVVLATGAESLECGFTEKGIPIIQAIDILNGVKPLGNDVLIIGGGLIGLETAEHLAVQGKRVTVIEMQEEVAQELHFSTRMILLKTLQDKNVKIMTNTKIQELTEGGAVCASIDGVVDLTGYDTVVWATGMHSYNPLESKLKDKVDTVHVIGDALMARGGAFALDEGLRLGLSL
ncbi:MAG: FAD-dependent oxidoreductase [Clostridia bacterium]